MADEKTSSGNLDAATKIVALLAGLLAAFTTWKTIPYEEEINDLEKQQVVLDGKIRAAEQDLKQLESNRRMTMELYQEVKSVIQNIDASQREEDAVRVLVESLADGDLKVKLLDVIAAGAKSEEVKRVATDASNYYREEAEIRETPVIMKKARTASSDFRDFNIDIFYCETDGPKQKQIAQDALTLKPSSESGRWRVRSLPESVNNRAGYGIHSNVIRYTPPDEESVAKALKAALSTMKVNAELQATNYPTPGYVSAFICG